MSLAICWKACVNSVKIISRMVFSLSVCPDFEQVGLQSFEVGAQRFLKHFDVFPGPIPIFGEKGQASAPVQGDQGLNNVVAVYGGFVIGSDKLEDGLGPQLRG